MSEAIRIQGLRKSFRRPFRGSTVAVDGLDVDVPTGTVFGFLGPNGSGKTTTIRCLLGLVRPEAGELRVLGADVPSSLPEVIGRIGSIVEEPAFFGGFSGRRNLELLAAVDGLPASKVDEALARTGLAGRADDRVRGYSLGMRQRLGLAAVLLRDPELLILDEPANGLDPAGLKDVRDLLRSLADEGRTVFISSHLLSEVQLICDAVAILSRGRCIAAGAVDEVLRGRGAHGYVVRAPNRRKARTLLRAEGFAVSERPDGALVVAAAAKEASRITRTLAAGDVYLSELRPEEVSLEAVFLELTAPSEEPG